MIKKLLLGKRESQEAGDSYGDRSWFLSQILLSIPPRLPPIIQWAEEEVKVFGVKGERFIAANTPWTRYPIELCDQIGSVNSITFVKPVQSGGSVVGEIAACRWVVIGFGGIQWNWDTDDFALHRWDTRIEKILKACRPVADRWPRQADKAKKCLVVFPNVSLHVQGVFNPHSLDSDSIPFQINEEIHKWKPGHLDKAYRRGTACAFPIRLNISNAGDEKDQLHEKFESGTKQYWEVKCPGCSNSHHESNAVYHIMRTQYDDRRPDLGGLRYDSEKCRRGDGTFNYNLLAPTLHYQMPCGYRVQYDPAERRRLSDSGRYSAPHNEGATPGDISLTYDAVTCHNIEWLDLVKEKHAALRSLKAGDIEPFRKFMQERECRFFSSEYQPFQGKILISSGVQKKREGMKNRVGRLWKADWQKGYAHKSELEHFWLVIKDVDEFCNDLLVYEDRIDSENELIAILEEYDALENGAGVIDCSFNTKHLLQFVYQTVASYAEKGKRCGINAIMSNESHRGLFLHREDKVRRFYDEGQAICGKLSVVSIFDAVDTEQGLAPDPREPIVINVNKGGMIANHFFIREHKQRVIDAENEAAKKEKRDPRVPNPGEYIECVIPGDVSEDFKEHYEAWIRVGKEAKKRPDEVTSGVERFQQIRGADHMLICCAGIDMLKDWSGLLGERLAMLGIARQEEKQTEENE
jgi:hypothetical protein